MNARDAIAEALEALLLDADEDAERALRAALEAAGDDPTAAELARIARAALDDAPIRLPDDVREDVLYAVAVQEVTGDFDPELAPLFGWIERNEPEYAAIRDGVAAAERAWRLHEVQEGTLTPHLARAWVLGALDAERTTIVCDRVRRGDPGVVEPIAELLRVRPDLSDAADLLAEDPPTVHRWRLALELGGLARSLALFEAAAGSLRMRVRAGDAEHEVEVRPGNDGSVVIGPDTPLAVDLNTVPGVEGWIGRSVALTLGGGDRPLAEGTIGRWGIVHLRPTGLLETLARMLPEARIDLSLLARGPQRTVPFFLVVRG